ncbi:MAG: hypothetical protein GF418_14625 [Chitinivibrionales bacterium]|nr:hypothetical protein [Chitinivibrionales bacterium]MBD3396855.1 hypothetical protein [Chitinivibrionales bacterium]
MPFKVLVSRRVLKKIAKLPQKVQNRFDILYGVLQKSGPAGPHDWQKYSKLSEHEYHCHLTYHYVACWRHEKKSIIVEVYYVGSREDAPYA